MTEARTAGAPEGLLLVDKPGGITSHDAVDRVRRALGTKKVGHAGTLDPMATGLLLIGVGRATRLLRFLGSLAKTYRATIRLGVETTTLDADGTVTREAPFSAGPLEVRAAMSALVGTSMQRPPSYAAVKVGGRRLYEAARAGEPLEADERSITVHAFDLLALEGPDAEVEVVCSGGTYVRVLAADVGATLGCGAHLRRLRRIRIGSFDVAEAASPDDPGAPRPLEDAVSHLPRVVLGEDEAVAAGHGRVLGPAGVEGPYSVVDGGGRLIGIYADEGARARPQMILARR